MPYTTPSCAQFTPEQLQLSTGTPVGAGAMSTVVQSTLRSSDLPVAVKILSKIQLLQQQKVEAAMNEKTALITLAPHPYIARLYGTAQSEDELYFVMEWLPHGDLLQHIRRTVVDRVAHYNRILADPAVPAADGGNVRPTCSPAASTATTTVSSGLTETALKPIPSSSTLPRCLPFRDIQLITAQLVLGLARAFEKGLVLRDLKPENIAFDDHYRAVLLDFDTVDLAGAASAPVSNHGIALRPEKEDAAHGVPVEETPAGPATTPTDHTTVAGASAARPPKRRLTVSQIQAMRKKTSSFCGTAQYVSPEMVGECVWSFASDLWSLGTVVYEMLYGTHMFSGVNAYAVLKKVLQGVGRSEATASLVSFPSIDFGMEPFAVESARAEVTATSTRSAPEDGASAFARVKDFILSLVAVDPLKRLGVHPETRSFDLDAVKRHPLFADFDWSTVESALDTFETYDFTNPARTPSALADTIATKARQGHDKGEHPKKKEDGTVASAASVDPSASLKTCYTCLPHHDESYAAYVYKATADANPFEHFLRGALASLETNISEASPDVKSTSNKTSDPAHEEITAQGTSVENTAAPATEGDSEAVDDIDSDSDSLEIVDDVGMQYEGRPAPPEFRS